MNTEQARFNMVEQQIRTWDVLDQDVLDLLYVVRREEFVPSEWRELAFSDLVIPLTPAAAQSESTTERSGDTRPGGRPGPASSERMWQPKMEARIIQELMLKKSERVLEVGTGSGYLTALLAHRSQHVFSVEINPELARGAKSRLAAHAVDNVTLETGDAAQGWAAHAPYDVIVLTASTPVLPQSCLDQLKPGGRLFAIVGDAPIMAARLVSAPAAGSFRSLDLFETCFPPLANALQPKRFTF